MMLRNIIFVLVCFGCR